MDTAVLEQMLDETFDHAVVHHGYTNYMRGYEVIIYATADPRTGVTPSHLRSLMRRLADGAYGCVSVIAMTLSRCCRVACRSSTLAWMRSCSTRSMARC